MTINISIQDVGDNLHPKITVLGVGGSGGNAVNNMISSNLEGVDFLIANTDAQALQISKCPNKIQLGLNTTKGLGAGMRPEVGKQAAEETMQDLTDKLDGSHMLFIAAGMGGGTGTGAAPVIAKLARERGILTVGVVTKPFHFEGSQRMKLAEKGLEEIQQHVDTLLTIPNQNLFRIANEKTTFADAFKMADDVLYAGVRGVTDLMVQPGMINLDFSDVKTVMSEMGKAMMGTGEASGEGRAIAAAEAAIANPLIDDVSLKGARGLIINITGGKDITLYEVDEAANRIKQEVDDEANIIYGTTCDDRLEGLVRVSIVATGIDANTSTFAKPLEDFSAISINNSVYKNEENLGAQAPEINNLSPNISKLSKEESFEAVSQDDEIVDNIDDNEENSEIETGNDQNEEIVNPQTLETNQETVEEDMHHIDNLTENDDSISENNLNHMDESSTKPETTVKRLSLFDTLDKNDDDIPVKIPEKAEPVISDNNIENQDQIKEDESNFDSETEIDVQEKEFDEDINQETEEELLDIPTFLRRQAN